MKKIVVICIMMVGSWSQMLMAMDGAYACPTAVSGSSLVFPQTPRSRGESPVSVVGASGRHSAPLMHRRLEAVVSLSRPVSSVGEFTLAQAYVAKKVNRRPYCEGSMPQPTVVWVGTPKSRLEGWSPKAGTMEGDALTERANAIIERGLSALREAVAIKEAQLKY